MDMSHTSPSKIRSTVKRFFYYYEPNTFDELQWMFTEAFEGNPGSDMLNDGNVEVRPSLWDAVFAAFLVRKANALVYETEDFSDVPF